MGSAYRLHRRTCYTKKEPPRRISEVLKVAATSSPTIFRSAVPSAMLGVRALAPSPARRRRAQPTPHTVRHRRHRARLRSRLDYFRTSVIPPDCIKSMVSRNKVFGNPHGLCLSALHWGPQRKPKPSAVCDGESGGTSCFYDLAEWYRHRNLVAEREPVPFLRM